MRHAVLAKMQFGVNEGDPGYLTLREGDVVQGVQLRDCPAQDHRWMRKAMKRAEAYRKPGEPPVRLVFFKALGVVRYAEARSHLEPTRKALTVPVEATDAS